jgi:hypothetical protein
MNKRILAMGIAFLYRVSGSRKTNETIGNKVITIQYA